MSRETRIREEIGWLKVSFGTLIALAVAFLGWLAQNFLETDTLRQVLAVIGLITMLTVIIMINRLAYRLLNKLEDL